MKTRLLPPMSPTLFMNLPVPLGTVWVSRAATAVRPNASATTETAQVKRSGLMPRPRSDRSEFITISRPHTPRRSPDVRLPQARLSKFCAFGIGYGSQHCVTEGRHAVGTCCAGERGGGGDYAYSRPNRLRSGADHPGLSRHVVASLLAGSRAAGLRPDV